MGSLSFDTFTDNPFFREIDFEALERKEIEPSPTTHALPAKFTCSRKDLLERKMVRPTEFVEL